MICPFCQNKIPEGETRCPHCIGIEEYGSFDEIDELFEEESDTDFLDDAFDGFDE